LIPWEQEKLFLDDFAFYLEKNANMNGHILFYVGSNEKASSIKKRAERAMNYLIHKRKVDRRRLFLMNVGKRDETLFILQPIEKMYRSSKTVGP
jgi:hypothetical protein